MDSADLIFSAVLQASLFNNGTISMAEKYSVDHSILSLFGTCQEVNMAEEAKYRLTFGTTAGLLKVVAP